MRVFGIASLLYNGEMRFRLKLIIISTFFIFFSNAAKAQAIEVNYSPIIPDQVFDSMDMTVTISVTASANSGIGYIRPIFKKANDLFGCVKTDCNTYYCGDDFKMFPAIYGSGTKEITIRVDPEHPGLEDGEYEFKLRRYTSENSFTDYQVKAVHITRDSPTATPLPKSTSCPFPTPTPTPTAPTNTPAPTAEPTPTPTQNPQPTNISLTEFVACPPSGSPEWIELYNGNDHSVTLTDWKMKDDSDNVSEINGNIGAKSYASFEVRNLNNDADTVRLYDGAGSALNSQSRHYDYCNSTMSWAKTSSGTWQQTPLITKNGANQFPTPVPSPTATPKASPTPSPTLDPTADPEVLGDSTASAIPTLVVSQETAENIATKAKKPKESPVFAILAIVLGLLSLIILGGYLWYDGWKKRKTTSAS